MALKSTKRMRRIESQRRKAAQQNTGKVEVIIKLQRPLSTNANPARALVYNKDHSIEVMPVWTDELFAWFHAGDLKVYIVAQYDYDLKRLTFLRRARNQNPGW